MSRWLNKPIHKIGVQVIEYNAENWETKRMKRFNTPIQTMERPGDSISWIYVNQYFHLSIYTGNKQRNASYLNKK